MASASSSAPEQLDGIASTDLRRLRAQIITGDIVDRVSSLATLILAVIDRELMHPARIARDQEQQKQAEAEEKKQAEAAQAAAVAANQAAAKEASKRTAA